MGKNNFWWYLSPEGMSSIAMNHQGVVFAPIERLIANTIVNKLINFGKKIECEECLDFIIKNHATFHNVVHVALFDLLMREYVWHMGEAAYKQRGNVRPLLRGIYVGLMTSRSGFKEFERQYNKGFVNVANKISQLSYIILSHLLEDHKIISEETFSECINKYCHSSHVDFENMPAPKGHKYEGELFIDIIMKKSNEEISRYYEELYAGFSRLSKGFTGDYPSNFFSRSIPIGDNSIYE